MSEVENALENIIEKEDAAYAEEAVGRKGKKVKTQKAKEKRVDRMEATGLCTCGRINGFQEKGIGPASQEA